MKASPNPHKLKKAAKKLKESKTKPSEAKDLKTPSPRSILKSPQDIGLGDGKYVWILNCMHILWCGMLGARCQTRLGLDSHMYTASNIQK